MSNNEKNWKVDHDKSKCALCVVCARHCPRGALRRDEEGENLTLYFNASLCDGCADGEALCEKNCPESAILSVGTDSPPENEEFVLLNKSEMAQCEYCDEYFSPIRRLDVIEKRSTAEHTFERALCPLCRRTALVVDYIENVRKPGSKAEYRSARDITRRASKRMKKEDEMRKRGRGPAPS